MRTRARSGSGRPAPGWLSWLPLSGHGPPLVPVPVVRRDQRSPQSSCDSGSEHHAGLLCGWGPESPIGARESQAKCEALSLTRRIERQAYWHRQCMKWEQDIDDRLQAHGCLTGLHSGDRLGYLPHVLST
jgi:hypothetical protein